MGKKLRALCITVRADHGGGPAHLLGLLSEGSRCGVDFYVASPNEKPYWERFAPFAKGMFEIPHRRFGPSLMPKLIRFMNDNGIDLLHSHGKGAGVYARALAALTGKPCIHTLHGMHVDRSSPFKKELYLTYERLTSRWVDHLIYVSKSERECAAGLSLFHKVPSTIVPNGVEIPEPELVASQRGAARKELFGEREPFVIGTLSRFDYQKNMQEAFEIARQCPELLFLWIGDGEDRAMLQEKAAAEGVGNIIFLGFSDRPGYYLSACDAYLSTSRWEGLPLGILEAMGIGLPIVASDVTGNVDALDHGGNGFLYKPGGLEEAASFLKSVAVSDGTGVLVGMASRKRAQQLFSRETMVENTVSVYRQVMGER